MTDPLLTLRIPMRPLSMNKWIRMTWKAQYRHQREMGNNVRLALPIRVVNCDGFPLQQRVDIHITAFMRPPLVDSDNIVDKPIIDGLKGWVIRDDDKRFVGKATTTARQHKENVLLIEIFPAAEETEETEP
jgi:Holliday junction resolvase RusA-like endonuclease